MSSSKNQQVADQTLKGAVVGVISYFLAKFNIDPGAQAAIMPLIITGLAYASTLVGDAQAANFFAKAAAEVPAVEAPKPVAKKAAVKKAVAKKPTE